MTQERLAQGICLAIQQLPNSETLTPLSITVVPYHPLVKRAAEPCAPGKPCPDKRYSLSSWRK